MVYNKILVLITLNIKNKIASIVRSVYNLAFIERPLPKHPFGRRIWATKNKYKRLHSLSLKYKDDLVRNFEEKYGFALNREWWSELALHTQVVIKNEKLNFFHGRLLYSVLSKYISSQNKEVTIRILETGTARGFSSICMAKALTDMKCNGTITTIDSISHNSEIFWNCIDDHEGPKSRAQLLSNWNEELNKIIFIQGWTDQLLPRLGFNRINFAFLDAQHTKEAVLKEFYYVSERQISGDIIVFDDVTDEIFPGVCEAVRIIEIEQPYKIERIKFSDSRAYAIAIKSYQ